MTHEYYKKGILRDTDRVLMYLLIKNDFQAYHDFTSWILVRYQYVYEYLISSQRGSRKCE